MPAADYVRFTSARGFMSVLAELPEAALAELGAEAAAIRIAPAAALLPVPVTGDDDPLTEQEVATAVTRHTAEVHERVGFKKVPWQRRAALEFGAIDLAPAKASGTV